MNDAAKKAVAEWLASQDLQADLTALPARLRAMRAGWALDGERIRLTANDARELEQLLAQAERDPAAWDACALILAEAKGIEAKGIEALGSIAAKAMRGEARRPTPPGRDPLANAARDYAIAIAVQRAMECGLPAYASGGNTAVTACAIVAEALRAQGIHMTADGVKKIWMKYPHD